MNYLLGIWAFHHDSATCLLGDGEILAAALEDRFTRKKRGASLPKHAASWCKEMPLVVVLLLAGTFHVFARGPALAPFIYTVS